MVFNFGNERNGGQPKLISEEWLKEVKFDQL
jgi:hypothetical protein